MEVGEGEKEIHFNYQRHRTALENSIMGGSVELNIEGEGKMIVGGSTEGGLSIADASRRDLLLITQVAGVFNGEDTVDYANAAREQKGRVSGDLLLYGPQGYLDMVQKGFQRGIILSPLNADGCADKLVLFITDQDNPVFQTAEEVEKTYSLHEEYKDVLTLRSVHDGIIEYTIHKPSQT